MTVEDYRARLESIEAEANAQLAEARRRFTIRYPAFRTARYQNGMRDVIIELAIANIRERIEREMTDRLESLETEFYREESCAS